MSQRSEHEPPGEAEFASYYGRPIVKQPAWKQPDVPLYLFLGGAAGTSASIAALASETGKARAATTRRAREARWHRGHGQEPHERTFPHPGTGVVPLRRTTVATTKQAEPTRMGANPMTDADDVRVRKALQGVEYPADKATLVAFAEERETDAKTMRALRALPDGEYTNGDEVEQAVPQRLEESRGV